MHGDGAFFDVGAFLDATFCTAGVLRVGVGRSDAVDRQETEVAQQGLVVHAAQGGVVDDSLRAPNQRCEAGEAAHRGAGLAAGRRDPLDVENDAAVHVGGTGGDEHELDAPGHLTGAFDVQPTIWIGAQRAQFTGRRVELGVAGPGPDGG